MHYKTEDSFSKAQKEGTSYPVYLLYGSENYLIERWSKQLIKSAEETSPFNLHKFDGKKLDFVNLYDCVETIPLMAENKFIYIDDIAWEKISAADQKEFEGIISSMPDDCRLVATAKSPAFDPKLAANKKLIALFDKVGAVVLLGARAAAGQVSFIKGIAKENGCGISTQLCNQIIQTCPADMLSLKNEVTKICCYAGGGEIEKRHIEEAATIRVEAKIFDLSKAIVSGNPDKALSLIDDMFYLRENPVAILSVLTRSFIDLYRACLAKEEGRSVAEIAAIFGYKGREFVVENAFRDSMKFTTAYYTKALACLLDCDIQMKSTGAENRILLEQTIITLFLYRSNFKNAF